MQQLIEKYGLRPHPEGGFYKEVYRSGLTLVSPATGQRRSAASHIYFLLTARQVSRFHRVTHDEIWSFCEGAPLRLITAVPEQLGPDYQVDLGAAEDIAVQERLLSPGQEGYFAVVPGGVYQAAESSGEYTLVGCTVAPGFDFADFSFLVDDPGAAAALLRARPDLRRFV